MPVMARTFWEQAKELLKKAGAREAVKAFLDGESDFAEGAVEDMLRGWVPIWGAQRMLILWHRCLHR